jgi:muramoyltetrapeptide carboxypeptidase
LTTATVIACGESCRALNEAHNMTASRRQFMTSTVAAAAIAAPAASKATQRPAPLLARRLSPGDTVALINPANAVYERDPYRFAAEALQALGFKVREAPHLRARYGRLAGTDAQRASDVNAMFADASVQGLMALTGGSGCNRILPLLDYTLMRRNPKVLMGFSDITALINAVNAQTGLVTFHSPVASSEWNAYSLESFRALVMQAQPALLANPVPNKSRDDELVNKQNRITTLRSGQARGPLVGGNLTVFAAMAGSAYWPQLEGAILCLEDVNEEIYRIDRMLSTLMLAGAFKQLAGVVLGNFTNCLPGDGFGSLTLDEVFDDYFLRLNVPVFKGAQFGHVKLKYSFPIGLPVQMDAEAGTLQLLQSAVS